MGLTLPSCSRSATKNGRSSSPRKSTRRPPKRRGAPQKTLLESFAPPSVVVNDKGEIIYLHGQTGKYLEPAQGRPSWNVFDMAREGFRFELRSAVHYALTKQRERRFENLPVKTNAREAVHLVVRGIVQGHGGAVIARSELGQGAAFHVFILDYAETATDESLRQEVLARGEGRVLLIDEEETRVQIE